MTRQIGGNAALLAQDHVEVVWLVRIDHADDVFRAHNGVGEIKFDDGDGVHSYMGVGSIGSFSAIKEDQEVTEKSYSMDVSGIDPQILNLINSNVTGFYNARIWIWLLTLENGIPASDPSVIFHGNVDSIDQIRSTNGAAVSIKTHQFWLQFRKSNYRKLSNASHQEKHPGDRFLEFEATGRRRVAFNGQEILFDDDGRFTPRESNN
jgi:hypothetical protein